MTPYPNTYMRIIIYYTPNHGDYFNAEKKIFLSDLT